MTAEIEDVMRPWRVRVDCLRGSGGSRAKSEQRERPVPLCIPRLFADSKPALPSKHSRPEPEEGAEMSVKVGDRIVCESERASQPGREGVIEEILHEDPSRVRVRWNDGHTSILSPSDGVARITPQTAATKS